MTAPTITAARQCSYCQHPAEGLRARLVLGDPASKAVALDHQDCYPEFMGDLVLISGGVEGAQPAAGYCHACREWTPRGRVVAEIQGDIGAGAVVVRCLACCRNPQRPLPAEPLDGDAS
ncbi:hypothetical protein [Streptacidiphilus sp. PAMC 29251]